MRVLDLFSGIGGFSLGLERAGMRTVAFCEIDPFCQRVLAKHWLGIPIHGDVRALRGSDVGPVDVVCGGFPCQDTSSAGSRTGLQGARSGLWREFARILGEVRPRYAIVENVAGLLDRGHGEVLGDLADLGFHVEWDCIPAALLGAHHVRDRVWIVAHADSRGRTLGRIAKLEWFQGESGRFPERCRSHWRLIDRPKSCESWEVEPNLGRVVYGLPAGMDRRRVAALGNAAVPQVTEAIGRAIMSAEKQS